MKSSFFFVNKSAASTHLSRSSADERSHLQRHVHAHCPRPGNKRLASGPVSHETDVRTPPVPKTRTAMKQLNSSFVPGPASLTVVVQEPFNAASVPLDGNVTGLMHYYVFYFHPAIWLNEMSLLRQGVYAFHDAVTLVFQTAVSNQMIMYCLLSAAACRLQYVDRLSSQVPGQEDQYIHQAVSLMAKNVKTTDLHQLLVCVMFMSLAESYRDGVDAACMHLRAAHGLLQPHGLPAVRSEALQGQLAMDDWHLACVKLESCLFECSYDPGPASILTLREDELLARQPIADALLARRSPLIKSIRQLAEIYSVRCRINITEMSADRALAVLRWITKRTMTNRRHLLSLELEGVEHALRVTLIMWSLPTMNVTGRAKTVKITAPKLRTALSGAEEGDTRTWILLVGAQCAEHGSAAEIWFRHELYNHYSQSRNSERSGTSLVDELIAFQKRYFFDEAVQRPRTMRLASTLRKMYLQYCVTGQPMEAFL